MNVKLIFAFLFFMTSMGNGFAQKQKRKVGKNTHVVDKSILKGQWKGGFNEDVITFSSLGEDNTAYVLELNLDGNRVSGSSYTYFNIAGKKYYSICRLNGSYNAANNEIVVTEVERTKANTPPPPIFTGCLQTHRLKLEPQSDGTFQLKGTWASVPGQGNGCESGGATVLTKRMLTKTPLGIQPPKNEIVKKSGGKKPTPKTKPHTHEKPTPKIEPEPEVEQTVVVKQEEKKILEKIDIPIPAINAEKRFEYRRKDIVKTIKISESKFKLEFYDNGEIDGDSISVFYNGKLVLSNQRLSDKPVSITLPIDKNSKENIVTMYADNLGSIPPNTAVMIVRDGSKTYEVRLESDLKKSASVIFIPED